MRRPSRGLLPRPRRRVRHHSPRAGGVGNRRDGPPPLRDVGARIPGIAGRDGSALVFSPGQPAYAPSSESSTGSHTLTSLGTTAWLYAVLLRARPYGITRSRRTPHSIAPSRRARRPTCRRTAWASSTTWRWRRCTCRRPLRGARSPWRRFAISIPHSSKRRWSSRGALSLRAVVRRWSRSRSR